MKINHLLVSWSVSRGQDTYGYNICRLDSGDTRTRYRACGGGYDMVGTVFGQFLEAEHQDKLQALTGWNTEKYGHTDRVAHKDLYGALRKPDGTVSLYGACGIESMIRIANACGLDVEREGDKKGRTIGFFVCPKDNQQ